MAVPSGYQGATLFVGWNQPQSLLVLTSTVHPLYQHVGLDQHAHWICSSGKHKPAELRHAFELLSFSSKSDSRAKHNLEHGLVLAHYVLTQGVQQARL